MATVPAGAVFCTVLQRPMRISYLGIIPMQFMVDTYTGRLRRSDALKNIEGAHF